MSTLWLNSVSDVAAAHATACALLASAADKDFGALIATVTIPVLLALGVTKCITIARRAITSTPCAYGLALVLGAILFGWLQRSAITLGMEPLVPTRFVGHGMRIVGGTGALFALVGLLTYRRARPPYRQGRKQAITALVIVGLVVGSGLVRRALGIAEPVLPAPRQNRYCPEPGTGTACATRLALTRSSQGVTTNECATDGALGPATPLCSDGAVDSAGRATQWRIRAS